MDFERWLLFGAFLLLLLPAACVRHPGGMSPAAMTAPTPVTEADYRIYDGRGEAASLDAAVDAAAEVSVVFLGEEHGNRVAHHLQAELLRMFHERYGETRPVVLAMEMFERDAQLVLDEYLGDFIAERHFLRAARAWPGYRSGYRPLVEYARANGLRVLAGNAPRRYANRVSRLGRDALADLPAASKRYLPPLPYAEASEPYRERFRAFWEAAAGHAGESGDGGEEGTESEESPPDPEAAREAAEEFERFLSAQSLWDASMADVVAGVLAETPDALVVHVNGKFHSAAGLGIPEHLRAYRPGTRFLVMTLAVSESFPELDPELAGEGDFVAATDPEKSRRSGSPHR